MGDAEYWGSIGDPVHATGAPGPSDTSDFAQWSDLTGFKFEGRVLDIGCGTGRMATLCDDYTGVDITPKFVEFARGLGRNASVITGPEDLPDGPFDRIVMLSVFTHIAREERQAYLAAIRERLVGEALVDILPGKEGGHIGTWYADRRDFIADLEAAGFFIIAEADWRSADGFIHRYYRVR